ncbi:unnamed protein product [Bursaphelenchus okinawaensis]|uniref:SSD domain-containing protein n=1 Tax=Bursaphelenchus okinawaensis TaxID=465554 RepID=A0A811KTB7_9BILA|nr:unnamed protein product [Bursaphelenchus okinawaensis]CAG9112256.1 unnamed protein product [Bursaphelenchus okinawaensis]
MKLQNLSFEKHFVRGFFYWGFIVHRFRCVLLWAPFFVTAFLACGFYWLKEQTTIDPQFVFSPEDAIWRYERGVISEHWPLDEKKFWPGMSYEYNGYVDVIAAGRPNPDFGYPNMLLKRYVEELDRINQYIVHNLTVTVELNDRNYTVGFSDLCMTYNWRCYENDHVFMLKPKSTWGRFDAQIAEFAEDIINTELKVTYPIGWRGTEPIYFGAFVGAPHIKDDEGHFDYVKAVRLTYNVRAGNVDVFSYQWRKKLTKFLTDKVNPASELLQFGLFHNESLPEGLQDVADTLTPKFAIMSFLLFVFCVGCSLVVLPFEDSFCIDWVRSKPILGLAGIVCPLLAVVSGWGIVLWNGVLYNAIVNVSPFIVTCIGIDDAFLMTAAWHRTNPEQSPAKRLAETLAEAAVAISITSITDMLTFGIGCMTSLPGVRLFCLYTFWGVTFTYIYQITYFAALMAYCGEMEDKGIHSLFWTDTKEPGEYKTYWRRFWFSGSKCRYKDRMESSKQLTDLNNVEDTMKETVKDTKKGHKSKFMAIMSSFGTSMASDDHHMETHYSKETFVNYIFRNVYAPFLLTKKTKVYVFIAYLIYIGVAVYGVSEIREGLNPKNLVRSSFYLSDFYELIDQTFWLEGLQVQVVVNNPPNLFDESDRHEFHRLVSSFEDTENTMNHNATMIFWDAYEKHLEEDFTDHKISKPNSTEEYYIRMRDWLLTAGGRNLWEVNMQWASDNESDPINYYNLKAFRFQVGLRNYRTPTQHTEGCRLIRSIARSWSKYNVTTFHEYYPFADQYLELKPALIRNCILAVLCMGIVAFLMIPHVGGVLVIVAAIISIDIGVIGYMTIWGVNLESVSMITIIMSIGFSVDLSAHISYAYVIAKGDNHTKAITALETLGWPVFLGAFSTVMGIMILAFVDAYIVQLFFKTVFLVISFSLLHGIVFLPIFMTVVMPGKKVDGQGQ